MANMFNIATKEWRWLIGNPMKGVKRPKEVAPRQRVITQDEIDRVVFVCGDDYSTAQGRVGAAFLFALETAMRAGEICSLTWEHGYVRHVHLPMTKNGSSRDVPLSEKAVEILEKLRRGADNHESCFGITSASLDALFRRAKEKAGVTGFTFHDSRRTALTRLAKVFPNVLDLARISGHRDIRLLSAVYYAPSIEDLAEKLQRPQPQNEATS
jgi:integrase